MYGLQAMARLQVVRQDLPERLEIRCLLYYYPCLLGFLCPTLSDAVPRVGMFPGDGGRQAAGEADVADLHDGIEILLRRLLVVDPRHGFIDDLSETRRHRSVLDARRAYPHSRWPAGAHIVFRGGRSSASDPGIGRHDNPCSGGRRGKSRSSTPLQSCSIRQQPLACIV